MDHPTRIQQRKREASIAHNFKQTRVITIQRGLVHDVQIHRYVVYEGVYNHHAHSSLHSKRIFIQHTHAYTRYLVQVYGKDAGLDMGSALSLTRMVYASISAQESVWDGWYSNFTKHWRMVSYATKTISKANTMAGDEHTCNVLIWCFQWTRFHTYQRPQSATRHSSITSTMNRPMLLIHTPCGFHLLSQHQHHNHIQGVSSGKSRDGRG